MNNCIRKLLLGCGLIMVAAGAMAQVKIGFLGTLSGPGAALGQDQYDAFMLAVEQHGGKLGGVPIEVIKEDDQFKPDIGLQLAQKLVQRDNVSFITGLTFSNVMMAVHKPITDARVFLIGSVAGPSPIAGAQCSPYFFSTSWVNDDLAESGGQLVTDLGFKRVFVMVPDFQAGRDAVEGFKRNFKGTVIQEVHTQLNQPDYSAELAQLQAAKPDAVYVFYPGAMGINFVKQYRQAGLLGRIPLVSVATLDGITLPALKALAAGAITAAPYSPDLDVPENKQFVAAFEKKFGRVPSLYAAHSYDAANLIDSALTRTKGNVADKNALRAALKQAGFKSVRGSFSFRSNQFPEAGFFRVDVAKDGNGGSLQTKGRIVAKNHSNLAAQCKME
ncbi:MAG: ABC transporter substrate-binding protein [Burkholderiales bacterium]|nr:ABC transporter substrate-binding protein [Burkholderiales bacterium]MDE1925830.1 ABC transporter substrate-binding protein [Burkholderiales bacterium]